MKYYTRQTVRGLMAAVSLMIAVMLIASASVCAQDYPNRSITFIVPLAPGGATDPLSRQFSALLEKVLGVNVNVENKPGGASTIGMGTVVRSKPDGYTIGLGINSTLTYQPLVNKGLAWKTIDDYQPIVKMVDVPYILAVRADAPWKTFEEFMADVKKKPGKIRASVSGMRGGPDLLVQEFNKVAGVNIATIPFTGGAGEALVALLGGRVESYISTGVSVIGHVQAGKVRMLAVFQKGKYDLFPEATPVIDAGYDVRLPGAYYVIAPKGLRKDVQDKLVAASLQVVRSEEFNKFCRANGYTVEVKGPEEVKAELAQYSKKFIDLIKFLDQK